MTSWFKQLFPSQARPLYTLPVITSTPPSAAELPPLFISLVSIPSDDYFSISTSDYTVYSQENLSTPSSIELCSGLSLHLNPPLTPTSFLLLPKTTRTNPNPFNLTTTFPSQPLQEALTSYVASVVRLYNTHLTTFFCSNDPVPPLSETLQAISASTGLLPTAHALKEFKDSNTQLTADSLVVTGDFLPLTVGDVTWCGSVLPRLRVYRTTNVLCDSESFLVIGSDDSSLHCSVETRPDGYALVFSNA